MTRYCNVPVMTPEQKGWYEEQVKDLDIVYAGFHGSHLYGLDRPESDIDIKAVFMPSFKEILMGNGVKTYNRKNEELDIEIEIKSVPSFLRSAAVCDTNCFDLLHTGREMTLTSSPLWRRMREYRKDLYAKNMKGLVGYIKTHSQKYSNKIERLEDLRYVRDLALGCFLPTVKDLANRFETTLTARKYIDIVTLVKDHEQQYLEVCGKKYIFTWSMYDLVKALDHEINRYGRRTQEGSKQGLDGKSLSHAIRVLVEVRQIARESNLTFPLEDAEYIKAVKQGKVPVEEVIERIDSLYDEVMKELADSDLPEEPSIDRMMGELFEEFEKQFQPANTWL